MKDGDPNYGECSTADYTASMPIDIVAPCDVIVTVREPSGNGSICVVKPPRHSINLIFTGLGAGYQGRMRINDDDDATHWGLGNECSKLVGVSIQSSSSNTPINMSSFMLNRYEFFICVYQVSERVEVSLYVETRRRSLRGSVELPQGGSVTIESAIERASLTGHSSYGIALL